MNIVRCVGRRDNWRPVLEKLKDRRPAIAGGPSFSWPAAGQAASINVVSGSTRPGRNQAGLPLESTGRGMVGVPDPRPSASGGYPTSRDLRSSDRRPTKVSVTTKSHATDRRDRWPVFRQRTVADVSVGSACGVVRPPSDGTGRSVSTGPASYKRYYSTDVFILWDLMYEIIPFQIGTYGMY